jgi:Dolichyl-phosphate-mannose-protein mannosyltransferase
MPARSRPAPPAASLADADKTWLWIVGTLLAVSTVLKLYHLTAPALDWHSWKQITTLAKARYIYRDGLISFFVPRVDLFTGLDVDSNKGFAEVPLLHMLMAIGYWIIGGEAEWVGRVWCIAFSVLGGVYLVRLVHGRMSPLAGAIAVAAYALSPYNLYFYRTLITDVPMTAFMIMGMYHFVRWLESERRRDLVLAAVATALAAMFKVYALFMGAAYLYLILRRKSWRALFRPAHIVFGIASVLPIAAWLIYGYLDFPDKPGVGRNLNATGELLGSWKILFDSVYYGTLWADMGDFGLTPVVGLVFVIGAAAALWGALRRIRSAAPAVGALWTRPWPDWLGGWWLGAIVYFVLVREGNRQHDYYQMCILPPLALGAGMACEAWWLWMGRWDRGGSRAAGWPPVFGAWRRWGWPKWVAVVLLLLSVTYGGIRTASRHTLALDSYAAGRAIAAVRKDDEKTLYLELGGLRQQQLLYYTGGRGWLLPDNVQSFDELQPYVDRGARYLAVSMRKDEWDQNLYPLPLVKTLAAQGHLQQIATSEAQVDRYDRPRKWAVYRIAN